MVRFLLVCLFVFFIPYVAYSQIDCEPGTYVQYQDPLSGMRVCGTCIPGTYSADKNAEFCIPCNIDADVLASCGAKFGASECFYVGWGETGATSRDECVASAYSVSRDYNTEFGQHTITIGVDENGNVVGGSWNGFCYEGRVPLVPTTGEILFMSLYDGQTELPSSFGVSDFTMLSQGADICQDRTMVSVTDGMVCGTLLPELALFGLYACMRCGDFGMSHSDGTRTELTDCFELTAPGQYMHVNMDTVTIGPSECPVGYYCPGNVRFGLFFDEEIGDMNLKSTGHFACSALSGDHDVSPENATSAPGAINPTDCYVDMGGDGASVTDSTGTYISSGGMCYYTE